MSDIIGFDDRFPADFHSQHITLKFILAPNAVADLEVVTAATFHWSQMVKEAASIIDSNFELKLGMIAIEEGSIEIRSVIEWIRRKKDKDNIFSKHPYLFALLILGWSDININVGDINIEFLNNNDIHLEQREIDEFNNKKDELNHDPRLQRKKDDFSKELYRDENIVKVDILDASRNVRISGTYQALGYASGYRMYESGDAGEREYRTYRNEEEVTLIQPTLMNSPESWTFERQDGTRFKAYMEDHDFLNKLQLGQFRQNLQTGIQMLLEIETRETRQGLRWKLRRRGRTVVRVLDIYKV